MLLGLLFFMAVDLSISFLSGDKLESHGGLILFLLFYVFWFFVLLWGYISGFKVGWRLAQGLTFYQSVQVDYLYRISRCFFRWITTFRSK